MQTQLITIGISVEDERWWRICVVHEHHPLLYPLCTALDFGQSEEGRDYYTLVQHHEEQPEDQVEQRRPFVPHSFPPPSVPRIPDGSTVPEKSQRWLISSWRRKKEVLDLDPPDSR